MRIFIESKKTRAEGKEAKKQMNTRKVRRIDLCKIAPLSYGVGELLAKVKSTQPVTKELAKVLGEICHCGGDDCV